MATLTIRNLPDHVRDELRVRAARNGRSMEAEARALLEKGVVTEPASNEAGAKGSALSEAEIRERVKAIQAALRPYAPRDMLASEQLIAERRLEAQREAAEAREMHGDAPDQASSAKRIMRGRRSHP